MGMRELFFSHCPSLPQEIVSFSFSKQKRRSGAVGLKKLTKSKSTNRAALLFTYIHVHDTDMAYGFCFAFCVNQSLLVRTTCSIFGNTLEVLFTYFPQ
jgi:hypothetical protein